ncbi:MAG: hypothetical protein QM504_10265 [Pseudomonadota bacterium]
MNISDEACDALFEDEKNEFLDQGIECECGCFKIKEDEYCQGDHCAYGCDEGV